MRRILCFSLIISIFISLFLFGTNAISTDNVVINGEETQINQITVKNIHYLPLRAVSEALGYEVLWNGENRAAELRRDRVSLRFYVDKDRIVSNDGNTENADIILRDGSTYVPVSSLCDALNLTHDTEKTNRLYLYDETVIAPFITSEYPIVFVPGTMGAWSSLDFASLKKDITKVSGGNSFTNATLALIRPAVLSIIDAIENLESNFKSYYVTQTLGKTYYIEPFGDTYVPLFQYLERNGLVQNEEYFIFGYDTLNTSIEENAENLKKYIGWVLDKTNAEKVQIIAHSQGGLVTRQYLQELGGTKNTAKFLGVCVPNHGVTYTYPLYKKGSFNPLDGREMFISILSYLTYGDFFNESKMRFVHENFYTLRQMLPTYYDMGDLKNTFLETLNQFENIDKMSGMGKENILMVTGSGIGTVASYDKDGKAVNVFDGDSTVLIDSARLDGDYKLVLLPNTKHTTAFDNDGELYYFFDLRK